MPVKKYAPVEASVYDGNQEVNAMMPMAVGSPSSSSGGGRSTLCIAATTVGVVAVASVLALVVGGDAAQDLLCPAPDEVCETGACVQLAGQLLQNMNTTVDPCDDFYEYSCGGWMHNNPIPDDKLRYSTFDQLRDTAQNVLRAELQRSIRNGRGGKAGEFFQSCIDVDAIEEIGAAPLLDLIGNSSLQAISNSSSFDALARSLAELHKKGVSAFFGLGISADDYDSSQTAVFISQDGLSLPSREYYLGDNKSIATDRSLGLLHQHISNSMRLACRDCAAVPDAEFSARATAVVELEASLAAAMASNTQLRDPAMRYNSLTREALGQLAPSFPWSTYLGTLFGPTVEGEVLELVASSTSFLSGLNSLLLSQPPAAIADYVTWQAIRMAMPRLSSAFRGEADRFRSSLYGSSPPARWDSCVSLTDSVLGFALSKLYVDAAFAGGSKASAEEMIADIKQSFVSLRCAVRFALVVSAPFCYP